MREDPHRHCCSTCNTIAPQAEMIPLRVPDLASPPETMTLWFCSQACRAYWLNEDPTP